MRWWYYVIIAVMVLVIFGVVFVCLNPRMQSAVIPWSLRYNSPVYHKPTALLTVYDKIVVGAKEEVMARVWYDAAYQKIDYPMGDVSANVGACTDVVIRSLRKAGYDLQQLIHEDMVANFHLYPKLWGAKEPDANIDHRRVPNQITFMKRFGTTLPTAFNETTKETWQPGDIVYWKMPTGRDHTGIVSDRKNRHGVPLVIHNAYLTIEDDVLLLWEIKGHYRFPKMQ